MVVIHKVQIFVVNSKHKNETVVKILRKNPEDFFSPYLTLADEPTSNLDSLNEGIILKSLREEGKMRTVLLVSHRKSTMKVADVVFHMDPSVRKART